MRRQIDERDHAAVAFWHLDARRQILGYGIVESHFVVLGHVGEQKRCKDLGGRSDFKDGVAVERARIALVQLSVGDDTSSLGPKNPHHDPDALVLDVDSIDEDFPNLGI